MQCVKVQAQPHAAWCEQLPQGLPKDEAHTPHKTKEFTCSNTVNKGWFKALDIHREKQHGSKLWLDPLVSLPCEMEHGTHMESTETQTVSWGSEQITTSNALVCCLGELGTAYNLVKAEIYQANASRSHLNPSWFTCNNFLNLTASSPTHPVCSYHSLIPLADTKTLLKISVHWGKALRRKPSPLRASMEDGWSCTGWIINRCSL